MMNFDDIKKILEPDMGKILSINPLAGDASTRSYYRAFTENNTFILQKRNPWKSSTEPDEITMAHSLAQLSVSAYEVITSYPHLGIIIQNDLGDLRGDFFLPDNQQVEINYRKIIDLLSSLQVSPEALDKNCPALGRYFGHTRQKYELDFFYENTIVAWLCLNPRPTQINDWNKSVTELLLAIEEHTKTSGIRLNHRDFHIRNLIWHDLQWKVFDFQDAFLANPLYDLTSLIWDAYSDIGNNLRGKLIEYYREQMLAKHGWQMDKETFDTLLRLTAIQRNIKAIGSFTSIWILKKNAYYLKYIPTLWKYLLDHKLKLSQQGVSAPIVVHLDEIGFPEFISKI